MDTCITGQSEKLRKVIFSLLVVTSFSFLWVSCGGTEQDSEAEGLVSGDVEILFDESIYPLFVPIINTFDSIKPEAKVTGLPIDALGAVQQLLSGESRAIVIARDFLPQEKDLIKEYGLELPLPIPILTDGFVLYARHDFPLDTLHLEQLKSLLNDEGSSWKDFFPQLTSEPTFIIPNTRSSEYAQLLVQLTNLEAPACPMQLVANADSAKFSIDANPNAVAFGFLSHILPDMDAYKILKISFTDAGGNYRPPVSVHQSHIVMGTYPLPVKVYGFRNDKRRYSLPEGFLIYLSKDKYVQEYYLRQGIVPENAKFKINPPE